MPNEKYYALRKYLLYVEKRLAYLKLLNNGIPSNESRYWVGLKNSIKDWGKSHAIYYEVLRGNLTLEQAMKLFGAPERTVCRMFAKQRDQLIAFIGEKEEELKKIYPFIPVTDIFEDCVEIQEV